uniref:receptor activity-modifying protein 2 n=1 Tax=Euleptes europaea TaxID=460621 RepID=UPI00253FBB63|nr:receptor activity-modifying protein 2 [Euleptes europaea]
MSAQGCPLQLLLLLLIGESALDAHLRTTVTPHSTNYSLEGGPNTTALEHEVETPKLMMMHPMDYQAYKDAWYRSNAKVCWNRFVQQMANVSGMHLCEWSVISRPYTTLRHCLEDWADRLEYGYPNALAENYTVCSHRMYFLNCTLGRPLLLDPPENVLLTLIITPICLIPFLVTLVVLKSKDGEMQA